MPRKCVFKDQQLFEAIHTQQSQFSGLCTVSSETITLQQKNIIIKISPVRALTVDF